MSNIEIVQRLYTAFRERDTNTILTLFDPKIEWIQNQGFPGGGRHVGPDAVLNDVFAKFRLDWETWQAVVEEWLDAGDAIVALGEYRGNEEKAEYIRAHGCDYPIIYSQDDFVEQVKEITNGEGVSVVYDGVGQATFMKSLDCLKVRGQIVIFGWSSGKVPPLDVHRLNSKSLSVTNPSVGHYTATRAELLKSAEALFDVVSSGAVNIEVKHLYSLKDAAQAHTDLEGRKTTGSIVLLPE